MKFITSLICLFVFSVASVEAQQLRDSQDRNQVTQRLLDDNGSEEPAPILPPKPVLQAVAGDGMVTLYWDDSAESHYDPFFEDIVVFQEQVAPGQFQRTFANPNNFQGYKVYKATDPNFLDALRITDNQGNLVRLAHEVMFDLQNDISGYHPASVDGQRIWLGSNTGIRRFWQDTGLVNGRTYYYAVVSFTFGDALPEFVLPVLDEDGNIIDNPIPSFIYKHPPLESPLDIEILDDGTVITGVNVVRVTPKSGAAGFIPPSDPAVSRVSGSGRGDITVEIVDPFELKAGNNYEIVFQDTLVDGTIPGTTDLVTKNFSLLNRTTGEVVFDRIEDFTTLELPVVEGFQLRIQSDAARVAPDLENSSWETDQTSNIHNIVFGLSTNNPVPYDYRIEVFDEPVRTSLPFTITGSGGSELDLPEELVNVRVFNETTGEEIDFAYFTNPTLPRNVRSASIINNNTVIIAGDAGLIQKSTDGGESWTVIESGVTERFNRLYFLDNQTGFVTGINGVILRTTDGGETWSAPLNTPTDRTLNGIYFPTNQIGYVAGNGGTILKTTDGGDNWVNVDNPAGTFGLNDVMFTDENFGWVSGVNRLLKTEDGGQTWEQIGPAQGISPGNYLSLHIFDENTGIFVGTNGTIQKTEDGGQTFINLNNSAFRTLNSIRFIDENTGWAVGASGSVIKSTDGGDTWVQQSSGTNVDLFDVFASNENIAVLVGENSTRIRTSDGGNTWIETENFRRFRAAFRESGTPASDVIYFLENSPFDSTDDLVDTWRVAMQPRTATSEFGLTVDPIGGDVLNLLTIKPFTASDRFEFGIGDANLPRIDTELAKNQLANIRVVPNPYLVAHIAEPAGERNIHFTNLPTQCTIRIFTVSGRLIQTLEVNNPSTSDRFVWDMKTNTNDDLPYGVYIYHVRAPGIGETTGKFAVIK